MDEIKELIIISCDAFILRYCSWLLNRSERRTKKLKAKQIVETAKHIELLKSTLKLCDRLIENSKRRCEK